MMHAERPCAILFIRAPQKGRVKTRLSRVLSDESVLALYKSFVRDIMETVRQSAADIRICYYPPQERETVADWIGHTFNYSPQRGAHLGERMQRAFEDVFSHGYNRAILLGTDLPDLPEHIIAEALSNLTQNSPVIGPAHDGGYYLIGFCRDTFIPHVFEGMPWGTRHVFSKTLSAFREAEQKIHVLPPWRDIDEYEDLLALADRVNRKKAHAAHTMDVFKSIQPI